MIRFLILALLLYVAYRYLKAKGILPSGSKDPDEDETSSGDTELIQDPQCGAYFLRHRGVEAKVNGRILHFCSEKCRNMYIQKSHPE